MDKASLRRNQPTVHVKWNENVGILSGDAMLIKSYELLSRTHPSCISKIFSLFNTTAMQVCEGQQYDMDYEEKDEISLNDYLKMIELKTSVLIGASLKSGAVVGGAGEPDETLLYEFGRNLGIAFQLQDDLLDLYADPVKFGKDLGNDIVCNKKTILLVQAMQLATGNSGIELRDWLKRKHFDRNEKITAVKAIFEKFQVRETTQELIRKYHEKAIQCLEDVPVATGSKKELLRVALRLLNRKR
jgi:geranylgeranyl diphosphate synthase type II